MNKWQETIYVLLLVSAAAFAGEFHGRSSAVICEKQGGGPENVAYLVCETKGWK